MAFSFFLEMAWKSAAISGAALLVLSLLRARSAAEGAMLLRLAALLLLLLPFLALFLPGLQVQAWQPSQLGGPLAYAPPAELLTYVPDALPETSADPLIWDDPTILVAILYAGGLAMVLAHLCAGLITLRRWTGSAVPLDDPQWRRLLDRLEQERPLRRQVRLLVSDQIDAPLSWGWLRPVILVDRDTSELPEHAAAVLVHEWAHIARLDWPALILSRAVAGLFWFNPLVHMLEREAAQLTEQAADREAADMVDPASYARSLGSWAPSGRVFVLPANGIAPLNSALARRVTAVLARRQGSRDGSSRTLAAAVACSALAFALAAFELVPATAEAEPPRVPISMAAVPAPQEPPASTTADRDQRQTLAHASEESPRVEPQPAPARNTARQEHRNVAEPLVAAAVALPVEKVARAEPMHLPEQQRPRMVRPLPVPRLHTAGLLLNHAAAAVHVQAARIAFVARQVEHPGVYAAVVVDHLKWDSKAGRAELVQAAEELEQAACEIAARAATVREIRAERHPSFH